MFESADTYLAICEIAAAFAGFSAIVAILDKRSDSSAETQLKSVLLICLLVIAASLIPVLLAEYSFSNEQIFTVSGAFFLFLIWLTIFSVSHISKASGSNILENVGSRASNIVMWTLEVAIQLPLILCIFRIFPELNSAFYMTALILNLFQAAQFFYKLAVEPRLGNETA